MQSWTRNPKSDRQSGRTPRERHNFRRWRPDRIRPERPPCTHSHRACRGTWNADYDSWNGAGAGPSPPRQAGSPLPPDSTGRYGSGRAKRSGRNGRRPVTGAKRYGRYCRCPRGRLCAKGRSISRHQRYRRSRAAISSTATDSRLISTSSPVPPRSSSLHRQSAPTPGYLDPNPASPSHPHIWP